MGIYMYLLTGTDGPKSAHTKHAAQCQVSVHKTQGANTHTNTHTIRASAFCPRDLQQGQGRQRETDKHRGRASEAASDILRLIRSRSSNLCPG